MNPGAPAEEPGRPGRAEPLAEDIRRHAGQLEDLRALDAGRQQQVDDCLGRGLQGPRVETGRRDAGDPGERAQVVDRLRKAGFERLDDSVGSSHGPRG